MKKFVFFSFLLYICVNMQAQQGTCGENVKWKISDETLTISGQGEMNVFTGYNKKYGGAGGWQENFVSNRPWDIYSSMIKKVIVEEGITVVGTSSFACFPALESVELHEGLKSLGDFAFSGCRKLTSIDIPNSVESIGQGAFGDTDLETIVIPVNVSSMGPYAFTGCPRMKTVTWNAKDCEGSSPFSNDVNTSLKSSVTTIEFGDSVEVIYNSFCRDLETLTTVNTSGSIQKIDYNAFYNTPWLNGLMSSTDGPLYIDKVLYKYIGNMSTPTNFVIPEGVTSISYEVFKGQRYLVGVTIPMTMKYIYYNAFSGCTSLGTIIWNAVDCEDLQTGVNASLTYATFSSSVYQIEFGEKVRRIPAWAFAKCSGIEEVNLPTGLEEIGNNAFNGCINLKKFVLPDSLRTIDYYALQGCSNITSIVVGENATNLLGVSSCPSIEEVVWNAKNCNEITWGKPANIRIITFGEKVMALPASIASGTSIESAILPPLLGEVPMSAFSNCGNLTDVSVPKNVTHIGSSAFSGCKRLATIQLPDSLREIGYSVFGSTPITRLFIPNKVESFVGAFGYMPSLKEIVISSNRIYNELKDNSNTLLYGSNSLESIFVADIEPYQYVNKYYANILAQYIKPMVSFSENTFTYSGEMPVSIATNNMPEYVMQLEREPVKVDAGEYKSLEKATFVGPETFSINIPYHYFIKEAEVNVVPKDAEREYGDANPEFEYEINGLVNNEDASDAFEVLPVFTCEANTMSYAGTYDISLGNTPIAHNYSINSEKAKLNVTRAKLTASVDDYTRMQGEENPLFVIKYSGWKNGESETVLRVRPIAITTATTDSQPGTYPIVVSGGDAKNYEFEYINGILTINNITGLNDVIVQGKPFDVYTANGVKVLSKVLTLKDLPKGVYVVNGRKVVLK